MNWQQWKQAGKVILVALTALLVFVLVWGLAVEPYWLHVSHVTGVVPGLPPAWEGQRIAVTGDFQVGMWLGNEATTRQAVDRILRERPAAALLLGDFVYQSLEDSDTEDDPEERGDDDDGVLTREAEIRRVVAIVRPLAEAGIPTISVLGGHDYAVPTLPAVADAVLADRVAAALEEAGVVVLRNSSMPLRLDTSGSPPLYIVGVGPHRPEADRPASALDDLPAGAPRIVIFHHPDTFEQLPPETAPLSFAGHTHGGQIRVPYTPDWSPLDYLVRGEFHAAGWVEAGVGQPGNRLYVNRGIGMSLIPIRLNARPELTLVTLTGG